MTTSIQLAINVTTFGAWRQMASLDSGVAYRAPASGRATIRSIRFFNQSGGTVEVQFAVSRNSTPGDVNLINAPASLANGEDALFSGVIVLPAGFALWVRVTSGVGYPTANVTIQAALLEIT